MTESDTIAFQAQQIAILTVSDTRTEETDKSGTFLIQSLTEAGHALVEKKIIPDQKYMIRAQLSHWIADPKVRVIIITGGTGFADRDITPEAVTPLLDKTIDGFGELFRHVSINEIGMAAMQSRALAGIANGTFIFCLPGSLNACRTAWNQILKAQLDSRTRPCNFVELLPKIRQES